MATAGYRQLLLLAMSYNTRGKVVDYKELVTLKLPRSRADDRCNDSTLYPVEVIEEDSVAGRVKIHYVGYSARYDEWRDNNDYCGYLGRNSTTFTWN